MKYSELNDIEKKQLLKNLYIQQKKSFADIANEFSTYANKIRRDAIKFKIKIRDKSDAQKNAIQTGSAKHPTKGKQRSDETRNKIGLSVMKSWENLSEKELKDRQDKARSQWNKLDDNEKDNMIKMANNAVRSSSKTGSKLEKFLLSALVANGYKVEFHKEQTLLNTKLQIDLFLPEFNIAIEVDGPSHYLPVWGDDALKRNIKYDNKKNGLLLGKGCVIIRIRQSRDFSPSRARIILNNLLVHISNIKNNFPDQDNRIIELGDK